MIRETINVAQLFPLIVHPIVFNVTIMYLAKQSSSEDGKGEKKFGKGKEGIGTTFYIYSTGIYVYEFGHN